MRPLVVKTQGENQSCGWLQLSRKYKIDVNRGRAHLSIFGGKLTDCVNVGDEAANLVAGLGVALPHRCYKW